jgi:uncharacterized damage-inducible protein DinB
MKASARGQFGLAFAIEYTEWANDRLLEYCSELKDGILHSPADGTFGTVADTLLHVVGAQLNYAAKLRGEDRLEIPGESPGFDWLRAMNAKACASLIETANLPSSDRLLIWDASHLIEPVVILVQAVHHGQEHRTQIAGWLTNAGLRPPDLQSWDWGFATGRVEATSTGHSSANATD